MAADVEYLKAFVQQLGDKDETVSALLKAHLFMEHLMDQVLGRHLGDKRDKVYRIKLRYAEKVSLLESFELVPTEVVSSLRALNKLRNHCVHTLNARITPSDLQPVFAGLAFPNRTKAGNTKFMLNRYMAFMCGYLPPPADITA